MKNFVKHSLIVAALFISTISPALFFNSTPVSAAPTSTETNCETIQLPSDRIQFSCGDPCKFCKDLDNSCDQCKKTYKDYYQTTETETKTETSTSTKPQTETTTNPSDKCRYFLGLTSWDCNTPDITDTETLKSSIWQIVINVIIDLTVIASYLILAFVIYGGYLYVFSGGDPNKVASGKKTLVNASIGLAIVLSANVIINTIRVVLVGNQVLGDCINQTCPDPGFMVVNTIQWVVGVCGVVALTFVVYGGISYTISSGDPGKVQAAKNMIMYALIGLAIVALAEVITAFIASTIRNANQAYVVNDTIISKEVYPYDNNIN